jgi:hypothetical protein
MDKRPLIYDVDTTDLDKTAKLCVKLIEARCEQHLAHLTSNPRPVYKALVASATAAAASI